MRPHPAQGCAPACVRFGVAEDMGRRRAMEDAHVALGSLAGVAPAGSPEATGLFAVRLFCLL